MKLHIISFCQDEEATIAEMIQRVPRDIPKISGIKITVIDDGSKDSTATVAENAGANVLKDGAHKGLAYRFREAVEYVLADGADIMVNIDGDLQFAPEDIPKLVAPIVEGRADFVAADRFADATTGKNRRPKHMPLMKFYGNKLGARVVSSLSGEKFNDVTCGFRAYNQNALIALNINGKMTYTQESFQVLAAKKLRIETVPITVKYFKGRQSRVVTSTTKFIGLSALNILRAFRDFAPMKFFLLLGAIPGAIGLFCLIFILSHYLEAGMFSPYKYVALAGVYLTSVGLFLWGIGLMADMLARVLNNQEKIYEHLRREKLNR